MQSFLNLCALTIQTTWRGQNFRKTCLPAIKNERQAGIIFKAFLKGWRVRKVMQNKDVFTMRQYIKDLTKVQEYFVYVERCENMMLLKQLNKDRRKVIEDYIETIEKLQQDGGWIKGYIGNQIIENASQNGESTDEGDSKQTPIKDYTSTKPGELRELISTERFLYDDDLQKNPYLFETDEFVRQKYLEKKYQAYSEVKISNDDFIKQDIITKKEPLTAAKKNLHLDDLESSRQESETKSVQPFLTMKQGQKGKSGIQKVKQPMTTRSENPRDNVSLPQNSLTFEQMLENAMGTDDVTGQKGASKKNLKKSQSQRTTFLKKKERYDPKKAIEKGQGQISNKNIESRRLFSKPKDQDEEEMSYEEGFETKGTFKNISRKSMIQIEEWPNVPNKTVALPSLAQKLFKQF